MVWFPHVQHSVDIVRSHFGITGTTYPSHDDGLHDGNRAAPLGQLACDFWPGGRMTDVMNYVYNNRVSLNVRYVVGNPSSTYGVGAKIKNIDHGDTSTSPWRQQGFIASSRWRTDNHMDHCHATFLPSWALSNPHWAGTGAPAGGGGSTILKEGASGAAVVHLQQQLNLTGLYHLTVDGDFGPATTAAVRDFQLRSHLGVDGVVGPQTQAALNVATSPKPAASSPFAGWPTLMLGVKGSGIAAKVVLWQKVMNALHANPKLVADGDFGPATVNATKGLQTLAKIVADGVAGPRTYNAAYFFLTLGKIDASKL